MKKIISVFLMLCLLPLTAFCAEEGTAREIVPEYQYTNNKAMDGGVLTDDSDETGIKIKKSKKAAFVLALPESIQTVYARLSEEPAKVEIYHQNEKKKYELSQEFEPSGTELALKVNGIDGKIRIEFHFEKAVTCTVYELRCFDEGKLPEGLHQWESASEIDVLILGDSYGDLDLDLIQKLSSKGFTIAVAVKNIGENSSQSNRELWDAGLRVLPLCGTDAGETADLIRWLRMFQPMLVVTGGSYEPFIEEASVQAVDSAIDFDSASEYGLWALPAYCTAQDDIEAKLTETGERNYNAVRAACTKKFETAQHSDPSTIPYPESRLSDGYLPEGEEEFIYDDAENGLWAYVSQSLQVEIVKYTMPEIPHTWFEANVIFKPDCEMFQQHTYVNASFEGQMIYPETLAQTSKLVFAVNADYHPFRVSKKMNVGNIIRQRKVLYTYDFSKSLVFPNLDTVALRDDGTLSVYDGKELTAQEILDQGDVHDALSFGPYLARDGKIRLYNCKSTYATEPRCALGMVEAGHFVAIMVEGKMPKGGEKGMDLVQIAELMYSRGVTDAINLDGGSTAVMIFMGRKLNRTGKGTMLGSPRNQFELFGIGQSEQVYTDMADGKKKK